MSATKWRAHYIDLVRYMARCGMTANEIAADLGTTKKTLYVWRRDRPGFAEAMDEGRDLADARVEDALYRRAVGYRYKEERVTNAGDVVVVELEREPNPTAAIFWLKNRRPDRWKDIARTALTSADGESRAEIVVRYVDD